jgi:hypothetical protein
VGIIKAPQDLPAQCGKFPTTQWLCLSGLFSCKLATRPE